MQLRALRKKYSRMIIVSLAMTSACGPELVNEPDPVLPINPSPMPGETNLLSEADVTFLLPLGHVADFTAGTEGEHGTLLPRTLFDELDSLTVIDEPDVLYANLNVVAVRLDPCFFEGTGPKTCVSQIRLVMQPVLLIDNKVSTRDATVHAFYEVPESEVKTLASKLQELRLARNGEGTIGLHPEPARAAELVLAHLGKDRLSRITFVSVHASDQAWTFGGIDIIEGSSSAIELPGTEHHEQHLTSTGGTETLDATILPSPIIEPAIIHFLAERKRTNSTEEQQSEALLAFERILDPDQHNSGTVDCASCHMSTAAKRHSLPGNMKSEIGEAYANSQNQRMLGFFGDEPSISPRVRAETQVVVNILRGL